MASSRFNDALAKDFEGHLDRYAPDVCFLCIHCDFECNDALEILRHLSDHHNFCINRLSGLAMLPNYLDYWRNHAPPFIEMEFYGEKRQTIDPESEEERNIRATLHKLRLEKIMAEHEQERTVVYKNIPCIFCSDVFTGTWHQYLQWIFEVHGFNPGRPANLVFIGELSDYLRKLIANHQCYHCYKKFGNATQLRNHMKKKPHSKIPAERKFDRYYMVNYLEEDRKWQDIEREGESDDDDEGLDNIDEERIEEFDEPEINETTCLICEEVFSTPTECIKHMLNAHRFKFEEIRKTLGNDFYHLVRFVNYARQMKIEEKCFICGSKVCSSDYTEHIEEHKSFIPHDIKTIVDSDKFLKPVIEGDPILTILEDTEAENE
jgi:uncharacterized C2H2 Zn-finger protein